MAEVRPLSLGSLDEILVMGVLTFKESTNYFLSNSILSNTSVNFTQLIYFYILPSIVKLSLDFYFIFYQNQMKTCITIFNS